MSTTESPAATPEHLFLELKAYDAATDIRDAMQTNADREFLAAQAAVREGTDDGRLSLHANELLIATHGAETFAESIRRDINAKFAGRLVTVRSIHGKDGSIVHHTAAEKSVRSAITADMGHTAPRGKTSVIKKGILHGVLSDGSLRIEKPVTTAAKIGYLLSAGLNIRDNYRVYPFDENGKLRITLDFVD